jgi:hypothetical protein
MTGRDASDHVPAHRRGKTLITFNCAGVPAEGQAATPGAWEINPRAASSTGRQHGDGPQREIRRQPVDATSSAARVAAGRAGASRTGQRA